ncbi:MAG: hypothetical protein AVDCRST_MAG27-1976 [uncultured Craurococcus sp.]|uniref:Uncharacterized protein n=1 Tax=uncultured Craurococcus sp. TaxID=1135998 RepID=A0A6J4IG10_9PROT|nr:MAG: hypothetical protein AVDCRST_MAG27-1976 [uncultured Craurococcus sp.]
MSGLIAKLLGRNRYRRRWQILAAAAEATADKATSALDRRVRIRSGPYGADQQPPPERVPAPRIPPATGR